MPRFTTKVPYWTYEGQDPGVAGYIGSTMTGAGQAVTSGFLGAKLFGAAPAAPALAAGAAALSPLVPILAIGIGIIGALISSKASKPKKVKRYQTIAARERTPLQVPRGLGSAPGGTLGAARSRALAQSYGQLPPGFQV